MGPTVTRPGQDPLAFNSSRTDYTCETRKDNKIGLKSSTSISVSTLVGDLNNRLEWYSDHRHVSTIIQFRPPFKLQAKSVRCANPNLIERHLLSAC